MTQTIEIRAGEAVLIRERDGECHLGELTTLDDIAGAEDIGPVRGWGKYDGDARQWYRFPGAAWQFCRPINEDPKKGAQMLAFNFGETVSVESPAGVQQPGVVVGTERLIEGFPRALPIYHIRMLAGPLIGRTIGAINLPDAPHLSLVTVSPVICYPRPA